jgi:AraC-like DNA-binding protein/ligand-binding sensor protein
MKPPYLAPVNEPAHGAISRLPVIQHYEEAFRKATGVSLTVLPPEEPTQRQCMGRQENGFCALATSTAAGCAACLEAQALTQRGAARQRGPHQRHCFAGLTDVAVPVIARGRHIATLMSGQVFRREPTQRDFDMVLKMLASGPDREWESRLRKAYFGTPVVTSERFEAIVQMLGIFAQYLGEQADSQAIENSEGEHAALSEAKEFVRARFEKPISLDRVVAHVGVNRFYFCKLFKRATGMTLTEYVTRVRLERVKAMLPDPSLRISEIVFAAGFGSIPRFNSVFKRHFGMPPTEYRVFLRSKSGG